MDYSEAKLQQLDTAATYRVYGHELEFPQGSSGAAARLRWRCILPCFCVHDSPDSPCPCMHGDDPFFWWLVDGAVVREGKSDRKDHEGNELQFFDVLLDSQIMVESLQPVSTGALKRLGDTISAQRVRDLASDSGPGAPEAIAKKIPPVSTAERPQAWTEQETAEFRGELRRFREGLPKHQREAFAGIVAGADAAFRLGRNAGAGQIAGQDAFERALITFRDGLPPRQRDAFTAIITAGAVAWGVAGPGQLATDGEQGAPGVAYMWLEFMVPLAVITTGVYLIVTEVTKEEEPQAPDLSGIPTTPEVPA